MELALAPMYLLFLRIVNVVDAVCLCSFCAVKVLKVFDEASTFVFEGESDGRMKLYFENWLGPFCIFFLR